MTYASYIKNDALKVVFWSNAKECLNICSPETPKYFA